MNNLVLRSITGFFFVAVVLGSILINEFTATVVFSIFFVLGLIEFFQLFKNHKILSIPLKSSLTFGILIFGILVAILFGQLHLFFLMFILPLVFTVALLELWRKKENPILNSAIVLFGIVYLVVPFYLIIHLTVMDYSINSSELFFPKVVGLFLLVWTNDTFAYLTGRLLGKTKLFERISPHKTWEGTIGGALFTLLVAFVIGYSTEDMDTVFWLVSAIIIIPCAILGDLFESLLKRSLNIKDSGNILPGHGGILDRFDAVMFALPFFVFWVYFNMYLL